MTGVIELVVDDAAADVEQSEAFEKVGGQFGRFYRAMLASGLPEHVAAGLTAKYGEVVIELLYLENDHA